MKKENFLHKYIIFDDGRFIGYVEKIEGDYLYITKAIERDGEWIKPDNEETKAFLTDDALYYHPDIITIISEEEYTKIKKSFDEYKQYESIFCKTVIKMLKSLKDSYGTTIEVGDEVYWNDPAIHDLETREERKEAWLTIWKVDSIDEENEVISISHGHSQAEVYPRELEVAIYIRKPDEYDNVEPE